MARNVESERSGLATAGLVLGIVGVCTSFIPIVNNLSFIMGILAIIFGVVTLPKKISKGKVITAIILGILSIVITINMQKTVFDALDTATENLNKASGNSTEEVLEKEADVTLGNFEVTEGEYGINNTKLTVTITNKTNETKSFSILVEATDTNGNRISEDYAYANSLTAGQSKEVDIFNLVTSDQIQSLKNATFKIVEASSY